jgi:hypothetical protein
MNRHAPRWPAVLGAIVCTCFTAFALFRDVRSFSDIGASQAAIVVFVVVAIISGYYAKHSTSWSDRLIMWFLFISCTLGAVGLGSGRTGAMIEEKHTIVEHAQQAQSDHRQRLAELRKDRDDARSKLPQLEANLREAQKFYETRCKLGPKNCDAAKPGLDTASEALTHAQERRDKLDNNYSDLSKQVIDTRPPPAPNADLNQFARVVSLFTSSKAVAKEWVETLWPFVLAIVAELGMIALSHRAFESKPQPSLVIAPVQVKGTRRTSEGATVTVLRIANDLGMTPKTVRKYLNNRLDIERPVEGWVFTPTEAEEVKQRIVLLKSSPGAPN